MATQIHSDDLPCSVPDVVIFAGADIDTDNEMLKRWVCRVVDGSGTTTVQEDIDYVEKEVLSLDSANKTEYEEADRFDRKEFSSPECGTGFFVEASGSIPNRCIFIEQWSEL